MSYLKLIYHYIITKIFYLPFCIASGKKVVIRNPILITPKSIIFGSRVFIRDFSRIEGVSKYGKLNFMPVIEIHDGVSIEQNLHLTCAESIIISKNTAIAANVTISDIIHQYQDVKVPPELHEIKVKKVYIGEDCKIYNNAVILPGVSLGKHCIVGANSVVTANIYQDYSIIAGIPAKIIKRYSFTEKEWLKTDSEGNFL